MFSIYRDVSPGDLWSCVAISRVLRSGQIEMCVCTVRVRCALCVYGVHCACAVCTVNT